MKRIAITFALLLCALPLLAQKDSKRTPLDPDTVYKSNCMRCHSAVREYSPSMTQTIVNHMRVRANLTEEEYKAILRYLADDGSNKGYARQRQPQPIPEKQ